ncbi:MAG: bifunctional (p)ppGpp synthetase/guanosine-3',5'-bis(diphosphate) 3'-pyrophosphohydrolase [Bacilli bacterium]
MSELSTMTIEQVLDKCKTYLHNQQNLDMIQKAYDIAFEKHKDQFRKSGDAYIKHPLEIAYMLADLNVGPATICAGLLHDTVEDTDYTIEELEQDFNKDVASIVDGVTKISRLKYMTKEKALAKSHQKILLAMAKDVRVIMVKLVDRVHNMRTLQFQSPEKQARISKETLDLYAPLAHRLGMYRIKTELEDLSFKYIDVEEYKEINAFISSHCAARGVDIQKMEGRLKEILNDNKISNYDIVGRVKGIYSVYGKMRKKKISFDQIYDLLALRIKVNTVEECYRVLGLVHAEWTPIPMRFKDYIATPKPNLYQSLHTTVVGHNGNRYEIQIRTYEMDAIAEIGVAAHWAYKEENKGYSPQKEQQEIFNKLRWYKELPAYLEYEDDEGDPISSIQDDIFKANVYVFTPRGDVIDLPKGATPLDFAYRIHTEVGNHTVGAIVNGKIVPLTYKMKTGDVLEIKTSKGFNGPTETWLKIVKTSHAKHKIISILNKRKRDIYVEKGIKDFEEYMKNNNNSSKLSDELINENFSKFNIHNTEDFYFGLGRGEVSIKGAYNKLFVTETVGDEAILQQYEEEAPKTSKSSSNYLGIIVDGLDKAQVKLASCCHPVLGDPVVGYVSKGKGIIVHRFECRNLNNAEKERFIEVCWDEENTNRLYESIIMIEAFNRHNMLTDIVNMINSSTVSIGSIVNNKNKNGELVIRTKVYVKNCDQLEQTILNLKRISDVYTVERLLR